MLNERLQNLRGILYQPPSEEAWRTLWEALEAWPEDEGPQIAVDYVLEHLSSWPEALRCPPPGWTLPSGWKHSDPRLHLLSSGHREDLLLSLIPELTNEPSTYDNIKRFFAEPRERRRVLWRIFREKRVVINVGELCNAPGLYSAHDAVEVLQCFEARHPGMNFYDRSSIWNDFMENLIEGLGEEDLMSLVHAWPLDLGERVSAGLGYALARRGVLSAEKLGDGALDLVAREICRDRRAGSGWFEDRGVWPDEVWGTALAGAVASEASSVLWQTHLVREALPHASDVDRARIGQQIFHAAMDEELSRLTRSHKAMDLVADEIIERFDEHIEDYVGRSAHYKDNRLGRIGGTAITWLALREVNEGRVLDPKYDEYFHAMPLQSGSLYLRNGDQDLGLALVTRAINSLPDARIERIFAAWHAHLKSGEPGLNHSFFLEVQVASGEPGLKAISAMMTHFKRRRRPNDYLWMLLLSAFARSGGVPEAWLTPHYRRQVAFLYTSPPLFEALPEPEREALFLAPDPPPWKLLMHFPSPVVAQHVVSVVSARPRKRQEDETQIHNVLQRLGELALPALSAALTGPPVARRDLLLDALVALKAPESAPVLIHLLTDTRQDIRTLALQTLQNLDESAILAPLEQALTSKKKKARHAAAEAFETLPMSDALTALASRLLAMTRDPKVRDALDRSLHPTTAPASPLDALSDQINGFDPLTMEMLTTEGIKLSGKLAELPPALVSMVRLRTLVSPPDRLYFEKRGRWDNILKAHEGDPQLPWMVVDALSQSPTEHEDLFDLMLRNKAMRPGLIEAVNHTLTHTIAPHRKPMYRWLCEDPRPQALPALIHGLTEGNATFARWCVAALASLDAEHQAQALPLLKSGKASTRAAVVALLEAAPNPDWLAPLSEATKNKNPAKLKEALRSAIYRCRLSELHTGTGFEDDTDEALSRLLTLPPSTKAPGLTVHSPTERLRFESGIEVPHAGLAWLIAQFAMSRLGGHDPITTSLCDHLSRDSRHQLAWLIWEALKRSNFPSRERRWASTAVGLLGDDTLIDALAAKVHGERKASSVWLGFTVDLLSARVTPAALLRLACWRRWARNFSLQHLSDTALNHMASEQGIEEAELLDAASPAEGINPSQARDFWIAHLEDAMVLGRTWSATVAREILLGSPSRAEIASGLVFTLETDTSRALVGGDKLALALEAAPEKTRVLIPHPLDMSEAERARWTDPDRSAPFDQMTRASPSTDDPQTMLVSRSKPLQEVLLHHGLYAMGYRPVVLEGKTHSAVRRFPSDDVEVTILHTGYHFSITSIWGQGVTMTRIIARRHGREVPWSELPARITDEARRNVASALL